MKIVHFSSGLGNQVFFYLFSKYLEEHYPKHKIYGYYNQRWLKKHNGLEVDKVFDITLPGHTFWSDTVAWFCRKLNGIGIPGLKTTDNRFSEKAIYFDGYYQDKKYFADYYKCLKYRDFELDEDNAKILKAVLSTNSVALHIRRGDYLQPQFVPIFGGICTDEYYKKAIDIAENRIDNIHYFVFSNDIEWVKKNLPLSNATYVTSNKGKNSYLDMFLMSHCTACILANSSFSFWGALLNKRTPLVIYPAKWNNEKTPDLFPDEWIGL